MNIEIHTQEKDLVYDLLGKSSATINDEIQISDQLKLRYEGTDCCKAVGFPEIAYFVLTIGSGFAVDLAAGVTANWLYDKLKGKKIKVIIERTEVEIDRGEIKKVIIEKLRIE